MPPVPTEAMFSFSLGDFDWAGQRSLQTPNDSAADAAAVVFKKSRRRNCVAKIMSPIKVLDILAKP